MGAVDGCRVWLLLLGVYQLIVGLDRVESSVTTGNDVVERNLVIRFPLKVVVLGQTVTEDVVRTPLSLGVVFMIVMPLTLVLVL